MLLKGTSKSKQKKRKQIYYLLKKVEHEKDKITERRKVIMELEKEYGNGS